MITQRYQNESTDSLIRRFIRSSYPIVEELKEREFYQSPSEKKHRKLQLKEYYERKRKNLKKGGN